MRIFTPILFLLLIVVSFDSVQSETCTVGGIISNDTVWNPTACEQYIVTNSLLVGSGVTLTIEPGTTVKFDSQKGIEVRGMLLAQGSSINPIKFTSNALDPKPGDWASISFVGAEESTPIYGGIIQYATIEYGGGGSVNSSDVDRRGNVRFYHSSPDVDHTTIRNSLTSGIYAWGNSSPKLTNNSITNNGNTGIHIEGIGSAIISGNLITDNSTFALT